MYDALQDLRIRHRWEALNEENRMKAMYKEKGMRYVPETLPNGDTMRQLLVRCSRLLVRKPNDWTESQRARAEILFERLPDMKEFYFLALRLGKIYSDYDNKDVAQNKTCIVVQPGRSMALRRVRHCHQNFHEPL
jgi:transposase